MSKLEELYRLREELGIIVKGLENFPKEGVSLIVSNHNCLRDIFYVPSSLPIPTATIISSRSVFKNVPDKQELMNKYLYSIPLEVRGGIVYSEMSIKRTVDLMGNGISVVLFPEGAYFDRKIDVYKGRVGLARILFGAREKGIRVNLVPVAINISSEMINPNDYDFCDKDISISILSPIDYEKEYMTYKNSANATELKESYHYITDKVLTMIARHLNVAYRDEYIELNNKDMIYFPDGAKVPIALIHNSDYVNAYEKDLNDYFINLEEAINKEKINKIK